MAKWMRPGCVVGIIWIATIMQKSDAIDIEELRNRAGGHAEYIICLIMQRQNCGEIPQGRSIGPEALTFLSSLPPQVNNENIECLPPDCEDGVTEVAPSSICFIIQKSCSVMEHEIEAAVDLSSQVAQSVGGNARVAFVAYSGASEVLLPLTNPTEQAFSSKLKKALKSVTRAGCDDCASNTAAAIEHCWEQFKLDDRVEAVKAIMIFTDGVSMDTRYNMEGARQRTLDMAQRNQLQHVTTVVVKYTNPVDTDVTGDIEWERLNNFGDIVQHFEPYEIILDAAQQTRFVEEELCLAIPDCSYDPVTCQLTDMVIIMDRSNSIKTANVELSIQFVRDLISNLSISDSTVRVGVISYNSDVYFHANISEDLSKEELINRVESIPTTTKLFTHTMDAITAAVEQLTNSVRRNAARQVILLATDGRTFICKKRLQKNKNKKNKKKRNKTCRGKGGVHRSDLTVTAGQLAKNFSIEMYLVGLPNKLGFETGMADEWGQLASDPFDCHFINMTQSDTYKPTFEDLKFVRMHIVQQLCLVVPVLDQCRIPEYNSTVNLTTQALGTTLSGIGTTTLE